MFRIIQPNTWYADPHGAPCKILRAGGYTLSSGRAMFIVFPKEQHAIVTTLSTGAIG